MRSRAYAGAMRVVVMGVTGCGKTSVGRELASALGFTFADADDFHSPSNVAKMAAGTPLTEDDRWPWLDEVGNWLASHPNAIVACSALRKSYRDRIRARAGTTVFLHLAAPLSVIAERVHRRSIDEGHFAGVDLLESQFALLEPLGFAEVGGSIDVSHRTLAEVIEEAHDILALQDD